MKKGTSLTEIDFKKYLIEKPTTLYQSPNRVHVVPKVENVEMYIMIIGIKNLNASYPLTFKKLFRHAMMKLC